MADHLKKPVKGDPTHQDRDINTKMIALALVVILSIVVFSVVAMRVLYVQYEKAALREQASVSPLVDIRQLPPDPILQVNEPEYYAAHREYEDTLLNYYQWIDRPAGTVRIPVDRAMDILLERGLPAREEGGARP